MDQSTKGVYIPSYASFFIFLFIYLFYFIYFFLFFILFIFFFYSGLTEKRFGGEFVDKFWARGWLADRNDVK